MASRRLWASVTALAVAVTGTALALSTAGTSGAEVQPAAAAAALPDGFKHVGYSTASGGTAAAIPYDKLTHVMYSFARPNADGSLQPLQNTAKLEQIVQLARPHGVKVMIAVGGWMDGDDSAFETLAATPEGRARHVQALVGLVDQYGLDGVDMDWEYPDPGVSAERFTLLMSELSTALHGRGKLLTAAVSSKNAGSGVQPEVFALVDFLNIMTYDGGTPHANVDWTVDAVNWWKGRGLPAGKAVVGVPFYSRPSFLTFADLVARDQANADRDCVVVNGKDECYNGLPNLRTKTSWALANAGGMMNWQLAMDATGTYSAVTAIYETATAASGS
ncbi:glycosyl hydrolase family 18 protein [Catenuloplanes indicus]|uniref:chitinase n=1 Tax=Catenuloplanes indicus TaxID=137267 RepID=A0AAE3W4W2_9ACTN|nr:glycosyl hydrolase family 18 protein [Catenuloplanes indicus]MDQ0369973.1 GH18 family chitinase [Catenuloplanes indicus]